MAIITISKEFGSGGTDIARLLAQRLRYHYVDKGLVVETARRMKVEPEEVEEWDMESHSEWKAFLSKYFDIHPFKGGFEFQSLSQESEKPVTYTPGFIDSTTYQRVTHKLILELAERDKVVIVGRGSQAILRDWPEALHVRIVCPLDQRIERIMERKGLSPSEAEELIRDTDRRSLQYVRHYYATDASDPHNYHLIINTGRLEMEACVRTIMGCLEALSS
jgi:cytidylate kinase